MKLSHGALRDLTADELPSIALESVLAGQESPSLAALAGATRADSPGDLWGLFEKGLAELGIAIPPARLEWRQYGEPGGPATP